MHNPEVKGQLAKLLATENLIVEHRVCETASFNVETRVLTLPLWDAHERVYNMLVGHEVGHALYTPNDGLDNLPCPKSYLNVTEDARIEKLMKRKFPGLGRDFYTGYQLLNEQDFFQIAERDLNTLNLIDRVNLHYKIGAYSMMPFDASETPLCDAVGAAETFQEAIDAAVAIYEYEKLKRQESLTDTKPKSGQDSSLQQESGVRTQGESAETVDGDSTQSGDQPSNEENNQADAPMPMGGEDSLESETDAALQDKLRDLTSHSTWNESKYLNIPNVDLDDHIVPIDRVREICREYWSSPCFVDESHEMYRPLDWSFVDQEFRNFKRECSREVNYLAKEFEMKKSAASYARESVSRTGVLDTKKLHTYKYNEDLFKKITVRPDGKNHGLIFVLDWSGSMAEIIHDTYKQLLSLCLFCRKVGIPFVVHSFTQDGSWFGGKYDEIAWREKYGAEDTFYISQFFAMPTLLTSEDNNSKFDEMAKYIWRITFQWDAHYGHGRRNWELQSKTPQAVPAQLGLAGTPLNESLVCLQTIIPHFQKKHGVEKVHISILTDGEGQHSASWKGLEYDGKKIFHRTMIDNNVVIRDRSNGKTYKRDYSQDMTHVLLRYLKGRFPMCNFLGFRICSTRTVNWALDMSNLPSDTISKLKREWAKNKTVGATVQGFQEIYFINPTQLNTDVEFDVAESATKAQIKSAFQKSLKSKANNKKILSSFVSQIA